MFLYPRFEYKTASDAEIKASVAEEERNLKNDVGWNIAKEMFKNEYDKPFIMSPGETAIFNLISQRQHKFSQILCSTQYGKTFTVARAILTRISNFPEDWLLVVPDFKRGKILLDYIIKDSANNQYFKDKLIGKDLGDRNTLTRLLEERSKLKLTYQVIMEHGRIKYGTIQILTTEARKRTNTIGAIMGFGGANIIADEASLVANDIDAGIFRMLAGRGKDTFLCKIGNPFFRNHFYESWQDPDYKKIFINDRIGLAEGRYEPDFLAKARKKPQYDILFGCKFPEAGAVDQQGFTALLTDDEIDRAKETLPETTWGGEPRIGVDVARGGGNYNVLVYRCRNYAYIIDQNQTSDLMDIASQTVGHARELGVKTTSIFVDDTGVGGGVTDKLRELKCNVHGVKVGRKTVGRFYNKRATNFWRLRDWVMGGGKLKENDNWSDLISIRYKTVYQSGGSKIQIISKDILRSIGIPSPDIADALMLTFDIPDTNIYQTIETKNDVTFDRHAII